MANLLSSTIGSHFYGSSNTSNILIRTSAGGSAAGILLQNSAGAFKVQIYGEGSDYGFLNGAWASWDIRKTIGGNMFMNNSTAYYLNTTGHSYLSTLRVADASGGVSLSVGNGSTHGVYTADNARKYLVVAGDYYPHMALVASGANNTNHGPVFSFVGSEGGNFRQWNLGISNNNPFLFSIGYNRSGDPNPHYGVGDGWSGDDNNHARLSIDRDGNTKIRGMLYVNGTSGGISTGNAVIHAGNIGSQSVNYANSSGVTEFQSIPDYRGNAFTPNAYTGQRVWWHFNNTDTVGGYGTFWHAIQTVSPWTSYDPSHRQQQIQWGGTDISFRYATSGTTWSSWYRFITDANIGSQSVSYATSAGNSNTTSQIVFSDLKTNFPSGAGGGHSFASNHYSMGLDVGNGDWSHPHYRDVIIGYHTGIRIGASYSGIRFYNNSPTTDANNDGNGDGGEALLMTIGGYVGTANQTDVVVNNNLFANVSMRAPIFYDSNDTTYYLDPNSTGLGLKMAGNIEIYARSASWAEGLRVRVPSTSTWGGIRFTRDRGNYDGNWAIGYTGIDSTDDLTFWGNNGGTEGMKMRLDQAANLIAYGSMRAPIFYDSADTGYYLDPNSTSRLDSIWVRGSNQYAGIIYVGGTAAGNRLNINYDQIWTNDGNLHLQYSGAGNIDMNYGGGYAFSRTSLRAPIFYDYNDTTYYLDPNSTSYLYHLILSGNSYFRPNSWIQFDSDYGLYWPNNYGLHILPNNSGSYGAMRVLGTKNGWHGIHFDSGSTLMMNSAETGIHREGYGWQFRWYNGSMYVSRGTYGGGTEYTVIDSGTIGSQSVSYASSAGGVSWANVSSKPATWLNEPNLIQGSEPDTIRASGFYESYLGSGNPTGTWMNYINVRHSNTANGHGFQLGMSYYDNNLWFRSYSGNIPPSFQSWSRALGTNTDPYPSNMNQYVRTTDDVTHNSTTSPTFVVNNHSDNTKGYRIHNTSGTSVSAMFTNSSNQLVIAAGAVDQINLNKKVYVNGVALGVNVAPSATAGRIDASNDIVAYSSSDERLKHNITPIENAIDKVKSLTGVEFDWKPEYKHAHGYEGHDTGIIAQQVQEVIPSAVRTNDTGFLAVRYEKLIGLLVEGMKEQQAQIEELKAKLDGLTK